MRDFVDAEVELAPFGRGVLQPHLPAPVDPVLEVLVKARAFVEAGWCSVPFSVDKDGAKNFSLDDNKLARGVQFCAIGALFRVAPQSDLTIIDVRWTAGRLLENAASGMGQPTEAHVNSLGQAKSLEMFDRAIAARSQS